MQRPIPATRSLPYAEADAVLPRVRTNLKNRGFTRKPYAMCAEVMRYGAGWAVYVGFQPDADADKASEALERASRRSSNAVLSWVFS
jgi:hypothetical protein